ncbi:MAG: DUF1993 domain-containing protein [Azospirillaceae bacterium]
MSLTNLLVPTYSQMLHALSGWLSKAEGQSEDAARLLVARLASDMFPLSSQIRFSCLQAYEAVFRIRGEALPDIWNDLAQEGQNAGDRPGTIADAQARITETRSFLNNLASDALDAGGHNSISIELPNGMIFDMTGDQYARDWALPQFNFHLVTAYAILRNQGVDLGKADYVQHAFAYVRPGTIPGT